MRVTFSFRITLLWLLSVAMVSCKSDFFKEFPEELNTDIEFSTLLKTDPLDEIDVDVAEEIESEAETFSGKTITLVSWNIQHLGRSKTEEEIHQIAQILRNYDLVAVQEVVAKDPAGAQAVAKIADELNRMGFQWDYQVSDPTRSPSVYISERYAFLWKPSRVTMIGRAKLDSELEDLCFREPFVGKFKIKGEDAMFYVANYHSRKYSDGPEEEIVHLLPYPKRLNSENIIIAGDFNTDEKNPVWKAFYEQRFQNALSVTKTTLKHACKFGEYRNHAIDNMYFTSGIRKIRADAIDFVKNCESLQKARGISDHLPVYMEFGLNEKRVK